MRDNKRAFVAGALVGGLVGLIFAPKSGKELREGLGRGSECLLDKTCEFTGDVKEKGKELSKGIKEKTADLLQRVKGNKEHSDVQEELRELNILDECTYSKSDVVIPSVNLSLDSDE